MAEVKETISIGSKADTRGFKKTESAATQLNKKLRNLAGTFGIVYSTAKVIQFGKSSVKALVEAEKANTRLANSVKNLGLSFSTAAIQKNLDDISRSAGIAGEVLVDAYQPLLTATGSVIKSQEMLNLALDVSAGSGVALTTVTQDLANAYVGNTRGLRKYNLGLSQAQLKAATFLDVQTKLNKQFSGAQASYLDTYAGKLQILGEAAGNAQERIGASIIDLTMAFAGSNNIEDFVVKIEKLTDRVVGMFDRFTEGVAILKAIAAGGLSGMLNRIQEAQVAEFNRRMKRDYMKVWDNVDVPMSAQALAQQRKAEAAAKKRAADLLKAQQKNTAELKKQNSLKKSATAFDLEQIQLIAALKGKLSEEDRLRVQAQLAILNENDVLAKDLTRQILMAQDESGKLYQYFLSIGDAKIKNPFEFLDKWLIEFQAKLNALKFPQFGTPTASNPLGLTIGAQGGIGGTTIQPTISSNAAIQDTFNKVILDQLASGASMTQAASAALSSARYEAAGQQYINVTVQGSVISEQDLTDTIAKNLQNSSLSSGKMAELNRRTGFFL